MNEDFLELEAARAKFIEDDECVAPVSASLQADLERKALGVRALQMGGFERAKRAPAGRSQAAP